MSLKKLAILNLIKNGGLIQQRDGSNITNIYGKTEVEMSSSGYSSNNNPIKPTHGVNVLLGGAMLSGIILVIFIMCYCCHKNARKQDGPVPITYWRDTGLPLHVYTVEGHRQYCETEDLMLVDIRRPSTPLGPPPSYDVAVGSVETPSTTTSPLNTIMALPITEFGDISKRIYSNNGPRHSDAGLPSYERAVQMQSIGHV